MKKALVVFHFRDGKICKSYDVCDGCEVVLSKSIDHDQLSDEINKHRISDSQMKIKCAVMNYEMYSMNVDMDMRRISNFPDIIVYDGTVVQKL